MTPECLCCVRRVLGGLIYLLELGRVDGPWHAIFFFFWSAPVAFRRVALETPESTSTDSNHHRQSVSAGKTNAIPTEPSGRLTDHGMQDFMLELLPFACWVHPQPFGFAFASFFLSKPVAFRRVCGLESYSRICLGGYVSGFFVRCL